MTVEFKTAAFEIKKEPDEDGVFEGYASVFEQVDQGLDLVSRGAFTKSLGKRIVKMLWQHRQDEPIGVWDEIEEDEKGLRVKGRVLKDVQRGREAMALMRARALDGLSIGYKTIAASEEGGGRVRRLDEIDLFEISLVTFPMLPTALVTDVKSIRSIRDFEKAMRDAGFSQKEAKAIAANGFAGLADHRDVDLAQFDSAALDALHQSINDLTEMLKNG